MTNNLHPCLWFDSQAKVAADFYCSVFKNSKITANTPMVVNFELNGKKFMGLNGGPIFKINPSISFFVNCESVQQTNEIWNKLIASGKVLMSIDKYPWSERYGWVQDQFGLTWQVSFSPEVVELKITPSMLFTSHSFGRVEEAINFYTTVFYNSLTNSLTYYPKESEHSGKIMFAMFKLNNYDMIAMDGPGAHDYSFNEAVSFVVDCGSQEEIDFYWNKLTADGGQESRCGWLKDKFGVSWQIVPTVLGQLMSDPARASRVLAALMPMNKLIIEKLVSA